MARVFITGSSDGLGLMAGKLLIEQGHEVVLHGRNEARSRDALTKAPAQGQLFPATFRPSRAWRASPMRSTGSAASTP